MRIVCMHPSVVGHPAVLDKSELGYFLQTSAHLDGERKSLGATIGWPNIAHLNLVIS